MTDNRKALVALIKKHGLTRRRVQELTGRSKSAVDAWLAPPTAAWRRPVPGHALELLKLKLERGKA